MGSGINQKMSLDALINASRDISFFVKGDFAKHQGLF
jgi:hypothetical protein